MDITGKKKKKRTRLQCCYQVYSIHGSFIQVFSVIEDSALSAVKQLTKRSLAPRVKWLNDTPGNVCLILILAVFLCACF